MSASKVKPDNPNQPDSVSVDTPPRDRMRFLGCAFQLLTIAMVLAAVASVAYFFYHEQPIVDEEDKIDNSVVIVESPNQSDDPESDPDEDVPPCSITSTITREQIDAAEHPLDPLIEMAYHAVDVIETNVQDYTATIVKRVRADGKLHGEQHMFIKIRHGAGCDDDDVATQIETPEPTTTDDGSATKEGAVPFSVYTRFVKPKSLRGQEAIWVQGNNDDKLIAHTTGILNVISFHLDPEGPVAMRGNRYSICNIGMVNLVKQMIAKGEHERQYKECEVHIHRNVMVGDARCTRIEIVHPEPRDYFDFHIAKIYFDDDRNLPIAYESYTWPEKEGGRPRLLERYYYSNIQTNVGLTDADFDPSNDQYDYPNKS